MTYILQLDQPALGNQKVYIHGLGSFGNGEHEISDEQEQQFRIINAYQKVVGEPFMGDENNEAAPYGATELVWGPPLEEVAKSMHGVTVYKKEDGSSAEDGSQADETAPVVPEGSDE